MKKLLTMLSSLPLSMGSTIGITNLTSLQTEVTNSESKIDLHSIKIADSIFNIEGQTDIATVRNLALMEAVADSSDPNAYDFINDLISEPDAYFIMGDINVLPAPATSLTFNYKVSAKPDNQKYKGLINFKITLNNTNELQSIDLTTIKDVILKQLKQLEVADIVSDDIFINTALKLVDQKLTDLQVNLYGHSDLLEWGYSTGQLLIKVSNAGDETNNAGFYSLNSFEISVNDGPQNYFKPIESFSFNIGRKLKDKISIDKFNKYTDDFSNFIQDKLSVNSDTKPDSAILLTNFDQYLLENAKDSDAVNAKGQLFSHELQKDNISIEISSPTVVNVNLEKFQVTISPNSESKIFLSGNSISFAIEMVIAGKQLIANDVEFFYGRNMFEQAWGSDTYDGSTSFKVIKWTDYANTWDNFLKNYAEEPHRQILRYYIDGQAKTNWSQMDPVTNLDQTMSIDLKTITTEAWNTNAASSGINKHADAGTSSMSAEFWTSIWHDDNYIFLGAHFYMHINCFAYNFIDLFAKIYYVSFI